MKSRQEIIRWSAMHLVTPIVALATVLMFMYLATRLQEVNRENQSYGRFVTCVLSVPALDRDQSKIDKCYETVEDETGINIQRY